jgi:hypothetical protein
MASLTGWGGEKENVATRVAGGKELLPQPQPAQGALAPPDLPGSGSLIKTLFQKTGCGTKFIKIIISYIKIKISCKNFWLYVNLHI